MKDLTLLDHMRVRHAAIRQAYGSDGDAGNGCFVVVSCVDRQRLRVIASDGLGWDHVSVSRQDRCPVWEEMDQVKRLFFWPDECAMQLHVPNAAHINQHPFCLHLWRPQRGEIPQPLGIMVG